MKTYRPLIHAIWILIVLARTSYAQAPAKQPAEMVAFRSKYETDRATAAKNLKARYAGELQGLLKVLTQRGDATGKVAVENELKALGVGATLDGTRASTIILPKLMFKDATIAEGAAFFRSQSQKLDPTGTGVPIILHLSSPGETRVTLELNNVSIADAAKYFTIAAGIEMTRDGEAIIFKSK